MDAVLQVLEIASKERIGEKFGTDNKKRTGKKRRYLGNRRYLRIE